MTRINCWHTDWFRICTCMIQIYEYGSDLVQSLTFQNGSFTTAITLDIFLTCHHTYTQHVLFTAALNTFTSSVQQSQNSSLETKKHLINLFQQQINVMNNKPYSLIYLFKIHSKHGDVTASTHLENRNPFSQLNLPFNLAEVSNIL